MPKSLFVLINGRGGVGKSSALHALLENPPRGWVFFDFDHGKFPPPKDGESGKEWRRAQHNWWLKVAQAWHAQDVHVCVFGVGIFPWQVGELSESKHFAPEQLHYGVITCSREVRRARLQARGTEHIAEYDEEKSAALLTKMHDHGVREFSSEMSEPAGVAAEVRTWLEELE